MLSLSSCVCKSFMRQVFNCPRKLNIGSVLLALLSLGPCINRELWDLNSDSEVWAFPVEGHFFEHHLSNLFQCMMFLQLVSSFVLLQLWLLDCPLTICSTWKSSLLVRMQQLSSNGHWPLALFWCRLKLFHKLNLLWFALYFSCSCNCWVPVVYFIELK